MFRPLARSPRRPHRRGTSFVLIVVVMISFAAAVGVAFALFAGHALRQSQAHKEAQGGGGTAPLRAPDPGNTVSKFFSAMLFGVGGDADEDVTNGLRGHEMVRSMYGGNLNLMPANNAAATGITTPWGGVGTFDDGSNYAGVRRSEAVNYTQILNGGAAFLFDPEYTDSRQFSGTTRTGQFADVAGRTRSFVSKAAGYSYPDLKDFFAAAFDPATGQVVTPSFHRPWLWNTVVTDPNTGAVTATFTLDPNNPNWTNPQGRMRTVRPRPAEHPRFPRVPPNADGTFTGDVQNWPGGYAYDAVNRRYVARNDSLWMHIGLPPVPFGNRKVQPLVAPLIVPLDGILNAGVHGNNFGIVPPVNPGDPPTRFHVSYAGYTPGEIHIGRGFATASNEASPLPFDRNAVVNLHANAQQRFGLAAGISTQVSYDPYRFVPPAVPPPPGTPRTPRRLPGYAPVAWGNTAAGQPMYPTGGNVSGLPSFGAGFDSSNSTAVGLEHPALHSAAQWSQFGGRQSPLSDIKRLHMRHAFNPDWYTGSELGSVAARDLGDGFQPFTFATHRDTLNRYRLDLSHTNRKLFTPYAFGLDRPKLAPNFLGGGTLAMNDEFRPTNVAQPGGFPAAGAGGGGGASDFQGPNDWTNRWAALGSVDINRPLADYRDPALIAVPAGQVPGPAQALSTTTVTVASALVAENDRRKLAHDIFVRLAVATGAALNVTSTVGVEFPTYQYQWPVAAGGAQFNALRYLAQVAVNIVDFRDEDDVSTSFVWNPIAQDAMGPGGPNDPRNFDPAEIGNRVVFGVEKPRLVLNEVYSEITNDPNTRVEERDNNNNLVPLPAGRQAHIKFWAELLNPMTTSNSNVAPDAVPLAGYQIKIARGALPTPAMGVPGDPPAVVNLYSPANVTGDFAPGSLADVLVDLGVSANGGPRTVSPNDGTYAPPVAGVGNTLPARGVLLVAPTAGPPKMNPASEEFNPQPAPGTKWSSANALFTAGPTPSPNSPGLGYTLPLSTPDAMGNPVALIPGSREFRRHVVLLRRKANPYLPDAVPGGTLPPGSLPNPHITVDIMDHVPSFDALHRNEGMSRNRGPRDANNPNGYDPMAERFAVGKVQAYAGFAKETDVAMGQPPRPLDGPGNYNTYAFPDSMVLAQAPAPAAPGNEPRNTFGRHNGAGGQPGVGTFVPSNPTGTPAVPTATLNDTIMAPFDWLVHLDRTVVNSVELFQMRDSAPHLVTQRFVRRSVNDAAPGVTFEAGYGRWQSTSAGLGRALELLSVKPFTTSVAHGGRVGGQVNVNAIRDKRVFNAVFDPRGGNTFDEAFVNGAWNAWMGTRTPNTLLTLADSTRPPYPASGPTGKTVQDGTGGTDAPFQAGAPTVGGGTFAYTTGSGENLTVLRGSNGRPALFNPQFDPTTGRLGQEYFAAEPLRKITNLTTTVTHTYAVFLTIGYFEIDMESTNPATGLRDGLLGLGGTTSMARLAHEAYLNVPGDMRQKYVAVVDLSLLGMAPDRPEPAARPFFTTLEETARPSGTGRDNIKVAATSGGVFGVDADGNSIGLPADNKLVLGYGSEQQVVTVDSVTGGQPGEPLTLTVTGLTRTAWAGSSVSNVRPGYPGPQAGFNTTDARFRAALPYLERVK